MRMNDLDNAGRRLPGLGERRAANNTAAGERMVLGWVRSRLCRTYLSCPQHFGAWRHVWGDG